VSALRRTARDLLTFIPFIIILIIPMTPLGHVLVFGFIQRYFPSFFPSQFTSQRQDIMMRYEDLKQQLTVAQLQAEREADEQELKRAEAAVARLTAPAAVVASSASSSSGSKVAAASSKAGSSSSSGSSVKASPVSHPLDWEEGTGGAAGSGGAGSSAAQATPGTSTASASATATKPTTSSNSSSSRGGAQEEDEDDGPAAQKLKALKEQLQEVRETVHTGMSEDE
jgi:hypothetical protein